MHKSEASILGSWGSRPPDFGQGVVGGRRGGRVYGSWSIIISYNVQEVIFPEVAVNGQFLPIIAWKIKISCEIAWKIEIFRKIDWKSRYCFVKLRKKSTFFGNLPGKIGVFFTRIHDPPDLKPDWRRWYIEFVSCKHAILHPQAQGGRGACLLPLRLELH